MLGSRKNGAVTLLLVCFYGVVLVTTRAKVIEKEAVHIVTKLTDCEADVYGAEQLTRTYVVAVSQCSTNRHSSAFLFDSYKSAEVKNESCLGTWTKSYLPPLRNVVQNERCLHSNGTTKALC
jgi:hypothetical protein